MIWYGGISIIVLLTYPHPVSLSAIHPSTRQLSILAESARLAGIRRHTAAVMSVDVEWLTAGVTNYLHLPCS
jgi:hypothetical protein